MLQIILFVLKILGWIFLVVLGLIVLVFLFALFTPLRYQVEARCKGKLSTLEAGVRFYLFFHLVSGIVNYEEKKLTWNVRAAWIKLGQSGVTVNEEETEEKDEDTDVAGEMEEKDEDADVAGEMEKKDEDADAEDKVLSDVEEDTPEETAAEESDAVEHTKTASASLKQQINGGLEKDADSGSDSVVDKIASIFEKIKYTFLRICDKIKALSKKAEEIKAFLENGMHQAAFIKMLVELKKLLFRMRPKQVDGNLEFGFEDPCITGQVLAGLSMLTPYWEIQLQPDFEHKVLDGGISVKGSVRLWPMAVLAWNMVWNRDVRRTVLDIKKMIFK